MAIKVHTKTISPAMAKSMLETSYSLGVTNRKVSNRHVDIYAEEMRSGRWKLNGVAIKLDEKGGILDGQHRLLACVQSGVPFQTIVMNGVERDTFDTLDCGRVRTTAQVLQMANVKYNSLISSIIRGVAEIRSVGNMSHKEKPISNTASLEEYNKHSAAYDMAAAVGATAIAGTKAMTAKMCGAIYYHLTQDLKQSKDEVEKFIREITSFDSSKNAIVDKLRKWNLANRGMKVSDRNRLGYTILTWNAMVHKAKAAPKFCEKNLEKFPKFETK